MLILCLRRYAVTTRQLIFLALLALPQRQDDVIDMSRRAAARY